MRTQIKFSREEITGLHHEMVVHSCDAWDRAEFMALFLAGRGFGFSTDILRKLATQLGESVPIELLHQEMNNLALQA